VTAIGQLTLPGEIDGHPLSTHGHRHLDRHVAGRDAVAFHHVGRSIGAVRQPADRGGDPPLAGRVQLVHAAQQAGAAEPSRQLRQPLGAGVMARHLRPQIGQPLARVAHVRHHQPLDVGRQPDGRNDQPLLVQLPRPDRQAGR
jgi:hypothetical protein